MRTSEMPTDDLKKLLADRAKATAALFVDEFHEPLDPAKTDWDGVAWGEDCRDIDTDVIDWAWPYYQAALVDETKRLCRRTILQA